MNSQEHFWPFWTTHVCLNGLFGEQVHCRWSRFEVIPTHGLFGGHGHALLDPGVAAEQGEHEASHVSPPHRAASVGHKVSLVGQELLSWRENKAEWELAVHAVL